MAHKNDTPMVSRRSLLKAGAGAGAAGVAATGGGGIVPEHMQPVGDADALGFTAGVVAGSLAAAGGVAIYDWAVGGNTKVDTDDVLEDQIYNVATSVADGRSEFIDEMQTLFIDKATAETPYANAAWGEIRAAATESIVNGGTASDAQAAALEALNKQTTTSIINMVERWNTFVEASMESLVLDREEGVGVWNSPKSNFTLKHHGGTGDWDGVPAGEINGNGVFIVFESTNVSTPVSPERIEGRDEPLTVYGIGCHDSNTSDNQVIAPNLQQWSNFSVNRAAKIDATHADLGTTTITDSLLYHDVMGEISTAYNNITSDLQTYCENLYAGITQGAIDPSDILGPRDMVDQFANSDQMSRAAVELIAVGADAPNDLGFQAKISHADLQAESLWGWLYPQFSGDPVDITPGTTLAATDYDIAYFGYESEVDGATENIVLTGDSPLEVLEMQNVDGQQTLDKESTGQTAGTNGRVTVWNGEDPPEPIANPGDHSGWQILVHGPNDTQSQHPIGDLQVDGTEHYLASTSLAEGDTIEAVEVVPNVSYSQTVTHVADPTTVGGQETVDALNEYRSTVEELKEELGDDGGAGIAIPGLGSIPGVGGIGGLFVLGGIGYVVYKNRDSN